MRATSFHSQTLAHLRRPCRVLLTAACQQPNLSQTSHCCTVYCRHTPCSAASSRLAPRDVSSFLRGFSAQRLAGMMRSTRLRVIVGCGRRLPRQIGDVCSNCRSMRSSAGQCPTARKPVVPRVSRCPRTVRICWLRTCPARHSAEQCRSCFCRQCYMAKPLCRSTR